LTIFNCECIHPFDADIASQVAVLHLNKKPMRWNFKAICATGITLEKS